MYVYAFLLYFLVYIFIICEAPPKNQFGTKKFFGKMWQTEGGAQVEPVEQPSQRAKRKRDIIDPDLPNIDWNPNDFYGVRSGAIFAIENEGTYKEYDLKFAYGVRLQAKLILTVCSAVTYQSELRYRVTYSYQPQERKNVTKCDVREITVHVMSTGKAELKTGIADILIHPMCDNQLMVDLAVLVTKDPLPESRNVWIHTAENLLFRRNLDKVIAAQAVLGKCSVPVYKKIVNKDQSVSYNVDYVQVHFQHWDACEPNVCSHWEDSASYNGHYLNPNRCNNLLNGTRYCMAWLVPGRLCDLEAGTPIFCDVGDIHGLMGFLLRETYNCWTALEMNVVMQGLNDAIGWIRDTLTIQQSVDYDKSIPEWMKNLRENYSTNVRPRIKPNRTPAPSIDITFSNFVGQQVLSIVNVYRINEFKCRGTLVSNDKAIVPCSCVSFNPIDMSKVESIRTEAKVRYYDTITEFRVSLMINGSHPQVGVHTFLPHPRCGNHYSFDSAMVKLKAPYLRNHKIAWVMTSADDLFKKMLTITAVADSSIGYNCYWINNELPSMNPYRTAKRKIRFVHWSRCGYNICPNENWWYYQQDRCYGPSDKLESTLFCIESNRPDSPACDITHGTPIFCNVEEARGFIGFVSKAMDLNETPCYERGAENQTAVIQGFDTFLPEVAESLFIYTFEQLYRDKESRSSSLPVIPSSLVTCVVFTISFIVLKK